MSFAGYRYDLSANEIRALRTLFTICAERGIGLIAS